MIEKILVHKILVAVVAVVALGGAGFVFLGNGNGKVETLTVKRGDYTKLVSVSGKVVPAETVDLAFSQTGRVGRVDVRVGDVVSAGTILASIENANEWAEIRQKDAAFQAEEAVFSELKRGTRPEEIEVSRAKVSSAEVDLRDARLALQEKISDAFVKADDAVRTKADQLISNPKSQNPQLIFDTDGQLKQDILSRRVALESTLSLWNTDISSGMEVSTLANSSLTHIALVKVFLEKTALSLSGLGASSSLTQTTIDGWKTDISTARTNISTATTNLVSAIGSVSSAQASLTLAQKELLLAEAGVTAEDIAEQEAKMNVALADLSSARARYDRTLVVAPFSGVVSKMDAKVGGVASANESLISMIGVGKLQIESFVPEINAPFVKVGDQAVITLDAFGSKVPFLAEVILTDPAETIRDGVSTYRATLQFLKEDARIKSGMTANIVVTTEEKKNIIAVPQGIVRDNDSRTFVMVRDGESFVEREVETGSTFSLGEIEITSGLIEGDVVLLEVASR